MKWSFCAYGVLMTLGYIFLQFHSSDVLINTVIIIVFVFELCL